MSYDLAADLEYHLTELAAMLVSVGIDPENAAIVTLDELLDKIESTYWLTNDSFEDSELAVAARTRGRKLKRAQARKLIYYREVLSRKGS